MDAGGVVGDRFDTLRGSLERGNPTKHRIRGPRGRVLSFRIKPSNYDGLQVSPSYLIKKYYNLTDSIITPNKEFIIKYTEDGQSELEIHRDQSIISYNILLNSEYEFIGGGTFFESNDLLVKPNQGDLLIHSGLIKHGGTKIISGTRYLLVGFLDVKSKYINPSYLSINHNLEDSYVLNFIWKPKFFNNQIIKIKNKPYCAKIVDMFYEKDKVLIEYNSKELIVNFSEIIYK